MKKRVEIIEVEGEGLEALLEQRVTLFCVNYFYNGILEGVNDTFVKLTEAKKVYDTGELSTPGFKTAEDFPNDVYVMMAAIEAVTVLK